MTLKHSDLIEKIFRFINKIVFIEKKTIFELENITLYPTEIHLMLFLHNEEDNNATRIAEKMGVTKGAVSQTLSRLEKKGILRKTKDRYNRNELSTEFTKLGKEVLTRHLSAVNELQRKYDDYLKTLPDSDRQAIADFLDHADRIMEGITMKQD